MSGSCNYPRRGVLLQTRTLSRGVTRAGTYRHGRGSGPRRVGSWGGHVIVPIFQVSAKRGNSTSGQDKGGVYNLNIPSLISGRYPSTGHVGMYVYMRSCQGDEQTRVARVLIDPISPKLNVISNHGYCDREYLKR